ncbi:hypothetical protein [Scytonema sp. PCC 10023]
MKWYYCCHAGRLPINEPPRRASANDGFPSVGDWRRQERQGKDR